MSTTLARRLTLARWALLVLTFFINLATIVLVTILFKSRSATVSALILVNLCTTGISFGGLCAFFIFCLAYHEAPFSRQFNILSLTILAVLAITGASCSTLRFAEDDSNRPYLDFPESNTSNGISFALSMLMFVVWTNVMTSLTGVLVSFLELTLAARPIDQDPQPQRCCDSHPEKEKGNGVASKVKTVKDICYEEYVIEWPTLKSHGQFHEIQIYENKITHTYGTESNGGSP